MSFVGGEFVTDRLEYDGGRLVTVYVPWQRADAVVFAADGGWHTERLSAAITASGRRSTMIVGVHGLPDDEERIREYVPNFDTQRFAAHKRFFVEDVRSWIASRFGVALPVARTGVWGASVGGEFALAVGLRHPDVYGAILCASPGAGYQPPDVLPASMPRTYLVAGRQEQFFLDNAKRWAVALRNAHADVTFEEREGEHGGAFWEAEFPLMVQWAVGS